MAEGEMPLSDAAGLEMERDRFAEPEFGKFDCFKCETAFEYSMKPKLYKTMHLFYHHTLVWTISTRNRNRHFKLRMPIV